MTTPEKHRRDVEALIALSEETRLKAESVAERANALIARQLNVGPEADRNDV